MKTILSVATSLLACAAFGAEEPINFYGPDAKVFIAALRGSHASEDTSTPGALDIHIDSIRCRAREQGAGLTRCKIRQRGRPIVASQDDAAQIFKVLFKYGAGVPETLTSSETEVRAHNIVCTQLVRFAGSERTEGTVEETCYFLVGVP